MHARCGRSSLWTHQESRSFAHLRVARNVDWVPFMKRQRAFVLIAVEESELDKRLHGVFESTDCLIVHLTSSRHLLSAIYNGEIVRPDLLVWHSPHVDADTAFLLRRMHRRHVRVIVLATFSELIDAGARRLLSCSWRAGAVAVIAPQDDQVLRHLAGDIGKISARTRTSPQAGPIRTPR